MPTVSSQYPWARVKTTITIIKATLECWEQHTLLICNYFISHYVFLICGKEYLQPLLFLFFFLAWACHMDTQVLRCSINVLHIWYAVFDYTLILLSQCSYTSLTQLDKTYWLTSQQSQNKIHLDSHENFGHDSQTQAIYKKPPNIHIYINMYMCHRGCQPSSTEARINFFLEKSALHSTLNIACF